MRQNLYLEDYFAGANVDELISCVFEALFMAVGRACLDEYVELVEGLLGIVTLAHMACRRLRLALAAASVALCLELLDEAGAESLGFEDDALAVAFRAHLYILRIICASASAMRTQRIPRILDLHLLATVDVLESYLELYVHVWARTLFLVALAARN